MPNTKKVIQTRLKKLWDFPKLSQGGDGRVFTWHFLNLPMVLDRDSLALLCFVIKQTQTDNTVKYNIKLLDRYRAAVKMAQVRYGGGRLKISEPVTRRIFQGLIERGFLLHVEGKAFLVNPNLTYHKHYVRYRFYAKWCGNKRATVEEYISHANRGIL